jgi:hypothetical protein
VVDGIVAIVLGVISYLWKQDRKHRDEQTVRMESRLAIIEEDVKRMPHVYATREDLIRITEGISTKLDHILEIIYVKGGKDA